MKTRGIHNKIKTEYSAVEKNISGKLTMTGRQTAAGNPDRAEGKKRYFYEI